ncbi:unnamed protein product [Fraxinus pennsylvanica]|uniref:Uncharacterized protein n=1 Tax=Fraxinus pennsylvanica TaxID=56036 RepID=A0AAD1ZGC6_9LAMI|nr:unnamed protein product [Fraxinus pennsylvanica]
MGTTTRTTVFFVIDGPTSATVLLGRDSIHESRYIPSSLHQCLIFWNDKGEAEMVQADHRPFIVEANSVESVRVGAEYGPEINKVDCLEEEVLTRNLDDKVIGITKPRHAQAQYPLVRVNISDEGEDRPTFVN